MKSQEIELEVFLSIISKDAKKAAKHLNPKEVWIFNHSSQYTFEALLSHTLKAIFMMNWVVELLGQTETHDEEFTWFAETRFVELNEFLVYFGDGLSQQLHTYRIAS